MHGHDGNAPLIAVAIEARVELVREEEVRGLANAICIKLVIGLLAEVVVSEKLPMKRTEVERKEKAAH
jgi:hypothetical protein